MSQLRNRLKKLEQGNTNKMPRVILWFADTEELPQDAEGNPIPLDKLKPDDRVIKIFFVGIDSHEE